tara:strand:- start:593 stop:754 length:162 start_codon:yes stop_codon:yes gene_type:complete
MLIFPLYSIGNKIDPFILGLPFSLGWIVICIIVQFLGILVFLLLENNKEKKMK